MHLAVVSRDLALAVDQEAGIVNSIFGQLNHRASGDPHAVPPGLFPQHGDRFSIGRLCKPPDIPENFLRIAAGPQLGHHDEIGRRRGRSRLVNQRGHPGDVFPDIHISGIKLDHCGAKRHEYSSYDVSEMPFFKGISHVLEQIKLTDFQLFVLALGSRI